MNRDVVNGRGGGELGGGLGGEIVRGECSERRTHVKSRCHVMGTNKIQ